MADKRCTNCGGSGLNPHTNNTSICPLCEGSGKQYDPGREFTYPMGPFSLNAAAVANPTNPQFFQGAASINSILNGVTCQISNNPFRWLFAIAQSTFPFQVQIKDAGSGSGRTLVPSSTQVHSHILFGTSERPMPLPTPYIFSPKTSITADFTDLGGAAGFCGVTNGSPTVTWVSGAVFNTSAPFGPPWPNNPLWTGATIVINNVAYVISAVTSQNQLTLAQNYAGVTNANIAYAVPNQIWVGFKGVELSA